MKTQNYIYSPHFTFNVSSTDIYCRNSQHNWIVSSRLCRLARLRCDQSCHAYELRLFCASSTEPSCS